MRDSTLADARLFLRAAAGYRAHHPIWRLARQADDAVKRRRDLDG